MFPYTSQAPISLATSLTAPRASSADGGGGGEGGGDDFLFDCVSAEDLLFNNLDETDFAALSAARSPPSSTLRPNPAALWAASSNSTNNTNAGIPCESMAALLSSHAQAPFGSGRTTMSDPSSPLAWRTEPSSPMRQSSPSGHHHHQCIGDHSAIALYSSGFTGASAAAASAATAAVPPISSANHQASSATATAAAVLVPHPRTQGRRVNARVANVPTVCLLAVGRGQGSSNNNNSVAEGAGASSSGGGLRIVVDMLTRELDRHGLTPEIDHVVSGERAVHRVKALARHGYAYRMVVLEVEGSLARAASTARDLRTANPTAPIVAIASPHTLHLSSNTSTLGAGHLPGDMLQHFTECLTMPVDIATVRDLAARWLMGPPPETAAATVAAPGGYVAVGAGASSPRALPDVDMDQHFHARVSSAFSSGGTLEASASMQQGALEAAGSHARQAVAARPAVCAGSTSPRGELSSPTSLYAGMAWPSTASWASRHARGYEDPGSVYGQRGSQVSPPSRRCAMTLEPQKGRVFGGGSADRSAPCRLFRREFARENAEAQEREFDFIFRHGTMVLKVEEDNFGRLTPVVCSACEYATGHLGDLTGKPLQVLFDGAATNKKTAGSILQHIEEGGTNSMCSYINLKSEGRRDMASFVSVRALSKRPERGPSRERLPPWYVLLKVCLPSTLGLIKEPALLERMYSRTAMEAKGQGAKRGGKAAKTPAKSRSKPGPSKRAAKKGKAAAEAHHKEGPDGVGSASAESQAGFEGERDMNM